MIDTKTASTDAPAPSDPPPSYENPPATSSSSLPSPQPPGTPNGKPTNFLYITRRNESVKGTYIIDPTLQIPTAFLPPLTEQELELGEERKNLRLESQYSSVDVDVHLVQSAGNSSAENDSTTDKTATSSTNTGKVTGKKTSMDISSRNGSVNVRLHTPSYDRNPFQLKVHSAYSSVTLYLPRSFNGPLQLMTEHGSVSFSPDLTEVATTFSEVENMRRCFVGDFKGWTGEDEWHGDEVSVGSRNGSIKVKFVDEERKVTSKGPRTSVFGKMMATFGL